ncbi:MAG: hypothetical protein M0R28_21140 [Pigmentiphaga sp.]|nr:hypothetical protein [Pigmentiphaga sp.]
MSRIIVQSLFKMVCSVGGVVRAPLIVEAASMDEADAAVMLFASQQEDYAGERIRIISATEIDTDAI